MLVRIIWRGADAVGGTTSFATVGWLVDKYRGTNGVAPPFYLVGATKSRSGEITDRKRIEKASIVSLTYLDPIGELD